MSQAWIPSETASSKGKGPHVIFLLGPQAPLPSSCSLCVRTLGLLVPGNLAVATHLLIYCPGTCVYRVVDGIEDGCGSDQPKFSFRVGQSGPECSSSPSPGPGTGAWVWGEVGRAVPLSCEPL